MSAYKNIQDSRSGFPGRLSLLQKKYIIFVNYSRHITQTVVSDSAHTAENLDGLSRAALKFDAAVVGKKYYMIVTQAALGGNTDAG